MSRFKVTYILPDDMGDTWEKEITVRVHHVAQLGEMVNLTNKNGYSQPFKVTGLRSWVTRWFARRKEHIRVYLNDSQMPLPI